MASGREPSSSRPLFCYGSLLWKSVLQVLLGRVPSGRPALLIGFERRRIPGERFPGLVEVDGDERRLPVRGLVFEGLSDDEAAIFDAFEDDEYEKRPVLVRVVDLHGDPWIWAKQRPEEPDILTPSAPLEALAYVWTAAVENELWVPIRDFVPHEDEYLKMCGEFVDEDLGEGLRSACLSAGGGLREVRVVPPTSWGGRSSVRRGASGGEVVDSDARCSESVVSAVAEIMPVSGAWTNKGVGGELPVGSVRLVARGAAMPLAVCAAGELEAAGTARTWRVATRLVSEPGETASSGRERAVAELLIYMSRIRARPATGGGHAAT